MGAIVRYNQDGSGREIYAHGIRNSVLEQSPSAEGCTNTSFSQGDLKVFTGQRDDPFVTDVSQLFRIKASLQDVYRNFTSPALGALRGRSVRADGTSAASTTAGLSPSRAAISSARLLPGDP